MNSMIKVKALAIAALLWAAAGAQASSTVSISAQPADETVAVGTKLEFYVTAASSTTNSLTYHWYKKVPGGSAATTGSNSATNTVASAASGDEGSYWVVITDVTSTNTSTTNKAVVISKPAITGDLTNKTLALGSNYTFKVVCTNRAGSFLWYLNATNALTSSTNTYPLTGAKYTDAGSYTLVLTNLAGAVTSAPSVLTILKAPAVTTQPTPTNIVAQGVSVTNSAVVDGDSPFYQWYFGRTAAASTSNTLILSAVTPKMSGTYTLVATNAVGKATSANWVLTVVPPPAITTQPKKANLFVGQKLSLSVVATGIKGYTNLAYQWYVGTSALDSSTNSTAATANLIITNVATGSAGNYSVVVTNFGGATTSSVVAIAVAADVTPPTLKVTDPGKSPASVTNSPYTLKGTAVDAVSVTNVAFSLNGINFTNIDSTNNWAKWSADVPLQIGSNTVWVQAADYSGNTVTNKMQLFYAKWYNLTVTNVGTGSGTVVGSTNRVQFGATYTLTVKASPRNKFMKWIGWSGLTAASTNAIVTTTNVIKFIATNDVFLTNEIDTNLFWSAAGTYNGLIWSTNAPTHGNVGFASATVTTNLTYSGKVLFGGQTVSISGSFDTNGAAIVNLPSSCTLSLALSNSTAQLGGTVSDASSNYVADFLADVATYSKTNPAASYAGNYTIAIPTDTNNTMGPMIIFRNEWQRLRYGQCFQRRHHHLRRSSGRRPGYQSERRDWHEWGLAALCADVHSQ